MAVCTGAAQFRRWIEADGRPQRAIALALGVKQQTLSAWLRGISRPVSHLRDAIAILTGGTVAADLWLLKREQKLLRDARVSAASHVPGPAEVAR